MGGRRYLEIHGAPGALHADWNVVVQLLRVQLHCAGLCAITLVALPRPRGTTSGASCAHYQPICLGGELWIPPGECLDLSVRHTAQTAEAEQRRHSYGIARAQNRADVRRPRWCKKCGEWKPERAHHCSVSGRCVLRMDHYCLWCVRQVVHARQLETTLQLLGM